MRPQPWRYGAKPTIWVDYTTGRGVTDDGTSVRPKIGGRRTKPNLTDLLDTALQYGAERIMLTGKVPDPVPGKSHFLIVATPDWEGQGHWLNKPVTGRFKHTATGHTLQVRTVEEWFGGTPLKPAEARTAWQVTATVLAEAVPGAQLALTPQGTGSNAWALSLPKGPRGNPFELDPIPADVAEELHRTSGQHRMEGLVAGDDRCDCGACLPLFDPVARPALDTFTAIDGRFMYAGMVRELGTNGFQRLNRAASADLLAGDPYARARYYVRFTIPDTWAHVGLLAVQHREVSKGWHYPNRPGQTFEAWADGVEIKIARDQGWFVEPLEALRFAKAKPLDTWGERMTRARARVNGDLELDPVIRKAVGAALRAMVIETIGNFASRLKGRTVAVWNPSQIPAEYVDTVTRYGEAYVYREPGKDHDARSLAFYQPHLASQVWARARARVLVAATARGYTGPAGVLALDPSTVLRIHGDAVYTTDIPAWAMPSTLDETWTPTLRALSGGAEVFGDDGAVGRLRIKGILEGVPTPRSFAEHLVLRAQADEVGVPWGADL